MIEIVRAVAAQYGAPVIPIVAGSSSSRFIAVRVECVREILRVHPLAPTRDIANLFAISRSAALKYRARAAERQVLASPTPLAVIGEVAARHNLSVKTLLGRERYKHTVRARKAAIRAVAKRCPAMSVTDIGRVFGRDHTTIIHALGRRSRQRVAA